MRARTGLLFVPYLLLLLAFLVVPIAGLVEISARNQSVTSIGGVGLTMANYQRVFEGFYLDIIFDTVRLAAIATLIGATLAYPLAYVIVRSQPLARTVLTCLVMVPLMTSVVVKVFGWFILLGRGGPAVRMLQKLGIEVQTLLNTEPSVVVGLVEFALPFMVFSLVPALDRISPAVEEAAANLGATPFQTFRLVILPLSASGLTSGALLCFGISSSAYVVPAIMGGHAVRMIAQQIYDDVLVAFDWPAAAAFSIALLVLLSVLIFAALRASRRATDV
ncbi:ABC transporter permease [Rhizobiales bacterium L72]|uniref:ABC transporter permease n=1 Tax=Propylenella binzhouense TaxID=2555902 RepID=A0A964T107_9HYPH|nr:ABC transporter permease [Propylenella binzhouense]